MKVLPLLFLAVVLAPFALSQTGSGGTLTASTVVGQNIAAANVNTTAGTASLSCPVTWFLRSTYTLYWNCAGGTLVMAGTTYAVSSGAMTEGSCTGGGRLRPTVCWYNFSGNVIAPDGAKGTVSVQARAYAGPYPQPGTVTAFAVGW